MEVKIVFISAIVWVAIAAAPPAAHADRRIYGQTDEAVTAPAGELDVESWTTYARLGEVDGGPASRGVRQMIELEYGITDRWDVALYNLLDAITAGDTASGYAGFKLESRYRPTFRGEWIVDPVVYLEVQELFRGDAKQKAELKLIVAKDFGAVNVAVNVAPEVERKATGYTPELEWAGGVAYSFAPRISLGGEVFGKLERADGVTTSRAWAGPALSLAARGRGALHGMWVTLAGGAGLTSSSDSYYLRAIVGLQF